MKKIAEHPSRSLGFLSRYHDGELSAAEAREFDSHAETCRECRFAREEYEAVLAMYRAAETEAPDGALAARISRRIDTELRHRSPVRYVTLHIDLVWASVLAVALVGALTLYIPRTRKRTPPAMPETVAETAPPPARPGETRSEGAPAPPARATPHPRRVASARPPVIAAPEFAPVPANTPGAPAEPFAGPAASESPTTAERPAAEALSRTAPEAAGAASALRDENAPSPAPLPIGGPVSPPVLTRRVEPVLPEAARRRFVTGRPIVLEAVISENGDVTDVKVLESHPPFDAAVVAAVRQWRYRPALRGGRPVPVYLVVTVSVSDSD